MAASEFNRATVSEFHILSHPLCAYRPLQIIPKTKGPTKYLTRKKLYLSKHDVIFTQFLFTCSTHILHSLIFLKVKLIVMSSRLLIVSLPMPLYKHSWWITIFAQECSFFFGFLEFYSQMATMQPLFASDAFYHCRWCLFLVAQIGSRSFPPSQSSAFLFDAESKRVFKHLTKRKQYFSSFHNDEYQ